MPLTRVALDADDTEDVLALYREYGWWDDRDRDDVERALANTDVGVGLRDHDHGRDPATGDLVAAARVVTDFVYYARVYDVVVAGDRRGEGVGTALMEAVSEHEDLRDVHLVLLCRDGLVSFYESIGFERYPESVAVPDEGVDGERELAQLIRVSGDADRE
ncbi:GNAT family N-acetyltransferase [Halobaculum sp. CBA1158]|uniref:GNAT family N-acetyltransferase n=1 Tax=Halobaculum sp. CBA1158 TaxID=2904243 RepID=UPI001F29555B|nr:GNAT family N-acetyltransferase [Halobaculum sp. CBA1158]UIP01047.1 GNAT family N-acetyltransferase [Halobaculum sp. CBA1158]